MHTVKADMPSSLNDKAEDNLRYIRAAMESATEFTGVSGLGFVLAGCSAVIASLLAAAQADSAAWLAVWMTEMVVAAFMTIGLSARKARLQGTSLLSGSGKKLLLAFIPTMIAGGILTIVLARPGNADMLPGLWLTVYGAAVVTAGAHSVRILPVMGMGFILLGGLAFVLIPQGDLLLGLGMGGFHIIAGLIIWRYFGG